MYISLFLCGSFGINESHFDKLLKVSESTKINVYFYAEMVNPGLITI